jgi:D-ribose pyranase
VERIAQMASSKIEVEQVPHEAFKQRSREAKAIIRTGECSPYANVILHSGVIF